MVKVDRWITKSKEQNKRGNTLRTNSSNCRAPVVDILSADITHDLGIDSIDPGL